uniref:Uncharacterized protein n=1 Tax=Arundo donax TaxID=35708 RepID=A0A0A9BHX2_ARUDO
MEWGRYMQFLYPGRKFESLILFMSYSQSCVGLHWVLHWCGLYTQLFATILFLG